MITVIAMRERTWLDEKYDFRQWEHLCRNYGADLIMVDTVPEIIAMDLPRPVVVWDESGTVGHQGFKHPKDGAYVFGKTHVNGFHRDIIHDYSVRINTPYNDPCLFGVPAAAIALESRAQQWGCMK